MYKSKDGSEIMGELRTVSCTIVCGKRSDSTCTA